MSETNRNGSAILSQMGAPRKGSHSDVLALRLQEVSSVDTAEKTGYSDRRVRQITARFMESLLPQILQLHQEGKQPGEIAGVVSLPESIVVAAIARFPQTPA